MSVNKSKTIRMPTAWGGLFVTLDFDEESRPVQSLAHVGRSGESLPALLEGIMRLVSIGLRRYNNGEPGIPIEEAIDQLKGLKDAEKFILTAEKVQSVPDALAKGLEALVKEGV